MKTDKTTLEDIRKEIRIAVECFSINIQLGRQLLVMIDRFEKETKEEWIRVEDGMPTREIDVLVCRLGTRKTMYHTIAQLDLDGRWYMGATQLLDVTHWMPLPIFPKQF